MDINEMNEQFSAEVAPGVVMLDVQGRKNKVFTVERAATAIELADAIQRIGGSSKAAVFIDTDLMVEKSMYEEDDFEEPQNQILVYYKSHSGRPNKSEIARAARVIARSEVRMKDYAHESNPQQKFDMYVTGTRALAYSEKLSHDARHAAFLVSTTVWYNENRSVEYFPYLDQQVSVFLDDINARLTEGTVSIAR